jgi:hypothetical protein
MTYGASTALLARVASEYSAGLRRSPSASSSMALIPPHQLPKTSQARPSASSTWLGSIAFHGSAVVEHTTGAPRSTQVGGSRDGLVAWPMQEARLPNDDAA